MDRAELELGLLLQASMQDQAKPQTGMAASQ